MTGQAKLLRVLQTGEFERLGSSQTRRVTRPRSCRPPMRRWPTRSGRGASGKISTTGSTSSSWQVPPLADRRDDILPLARAFPRTKAIRVQPGRGARAGAARLAGQRARAAQLHPPGLPARGLRQRIAAHGPRCCQVPMAVARSGAMRPSSPASRIATKSKAALTRHEGVIAQGRARPRAVPAVPLPAHGKARHRRPAVRRTGADTCDSGSSPRRSC